MDASISTSDWAVFWLVAGSRLLLPLLIPRFPLPAILAALLLDGVDQTVFQQFTGLPLDGYQGYDKALDIYYLSIAYISILRNWADLFAIRLAQFLFYWRLVGVALFELTQLRPLLLIFPNTFEYFFIFYELCRLRWEPARIGKKALLGAAAAIWIGLKLPQEYWIHILQADTTDWLKINLFAVPLETPWREIWASHTGLLVTAFALVALLLAAAWWLLSRYLPAPDRAAALSADAYQPAFSAEQVHEAMDSEARTILDAALIEKAVLISLVSLSFAQVLPGVQASNLELSLGLGLVVVVNTALTHWLARRGFGWAFSFGQFGALATLNLIGLLAYALLRTRFFDPVSVLNILFFVLLLTLLITLYDRYRQVYLMRVGPRTERGPR